MKAELLALAERVEALTGPDADVDAAIYVALGNPMWPNAACRPFGTVFTGSLDAARSLVPEGRSYQVNRTDDGGTAFVGTRCEWDQHEGKAATEELALTAAALRARAEACE